MPRESQAIRKQRIAAMEHLTCAFGISFNALLSEVCWGKPGAAVSSYLAPMARSNRSKRPEKTSNKTSGRKNGKSKEDEPKQRFRIEQKLATGNINLILPTAETTNRLGYPEHRSVLPGTAGIDSRIANACFCFYSPTGSVRWPIRPEQAAIIYPEVDLSRASLVLTEEFEDSPHPIVLEIIQSVSALERALDEREKTIGQSIASGDFGFAVLALNGEAAELDIRAKSLRDRVRRIVVEEAVTAGKLATHIKHRKKAGKE